MLSVEGLVSGADAGVADEVSGVVSVSEVGVMFSWGFTSDCSGLLTF